MAAFSTTITKIGVNGFHLNSSDAMLSGSTGTTQITMTCGCMEDVFIAGYNPTGAADITVAITASTAAGYASIGRGSVTFTTALASSDHFFISGLESAWFQSTSNSFVITASTTIEMFAFERSSTRQR